MKKRKSRRETRNSSATASAQTLEEMLNAFRSTVLDQVRRRLKRLVRKYGAQYAGIGKPHQGGKLIEQSPLHVRFYVTKKSKRPAKDKLIPKALNFRVAVAGRHTRLKVPTDVVVAPRLKFLTAQSGQISYIYNKNDAQEQGSGGAIVEQRSTQSTYLLTAGHVAARNRIIVDPIIGEDILREPGTALGLLKYAPTITKTNPLDTALVSIKPSDYGIIVRRSSGAVQNVRKPDALHTGESEDFILLSWYKDRTMRFVATLQDIPVPRVYAAGDVRFPQLLEFEGDAEGGDSGALMIDQDNLAVGLHVLGNPDSGSSLCIPIETVLNNTIPGESLTLVY